MCSDHRIVKKKMFELLQYFFAEIIELDLRASCGPMKFTAKARCARYKFALLSENETKSQTRLYALQSRKNDKRPFAEIFLKWKSQVRKGLDTQTVRLYSHVIYPYTLIYDRITPTSIEKPPSDCR